MIQIKTLHSHIYIYNQGGALAFDICTIPQCRNVQNFLTGVILCAPMVKVSDDLKPPDFVIKLLSVVATWIPLAPITPIDNVIDRCLKCPNALQRAKDNLLGYSGKPRLQTALAMLDTTDDISSRMNELHHPVLILHGGGDIVTCPKLSAVLYDNCGSEDKTLRIYPGLLIKYILHINYCCYRSCYTDNTSFF